MTREERIEAAIATVGKTSPGEWFACCSSVDNAHSHFIFSGDGEACICAMRQNDPNDSYEVYEPLEDTVTHSERQNNARVLQAACDLRDEVIALRAHGQWISVKERLPDEKTFVMASDGRETIMLYFRNGTFGIKTIKGDVDAKNITHWMPLPPPPAIEGAAHE